MKTARSVSVQSVEVGDAFTEGNSWHYTRSVFHDPQGLIDLMGGKDGFNQMMDSVFITASIFDESYYGAVIPEVREMQIMNMGNYAWQPTDSAHALYVQLFRPTLEGATLDS